MKSATNKQHVDRLDGLDVARFLAFVGMVIVNFKIVMGAQSVTGSLLSNFAQALEGRAAATFVVLAGIGIGLASSRSRYQQTIPATFKRALFLLVLGLLNSLIFEADIIHYYAFYFIFGMFFLTLSNNNLIYSIVAIIIIFVVMVATLNYDAGWDWENYSYSNFWTPTGFIRNLFFNGWHPVIPWLSFLLFGIWLSRLGLPKTNIQNRMIMLGALVFIANIYLSTFLINTITGSDPELKILFGTSPIPPMPLYMIAGMSMSAIIVGLCLRSSAWLRRAGILQLITPAGRQTLTLYIAHILLGMGTLQVLGLFGNQNLKIAILASIIFCTIATLYAYFWSKKFKHGPIEAIMRKVAG